MGLLDYFFSGKNAPRSKNKISKYKENWEIYLTNIDDQIGSIIVDLDLREVAPIKEMPNLVWITIKMNDPRENGLISKQESELLDVIEKKLVSSLTTNLKAIYAGRTVADGNLDFYLYLGDTTQCEKLISNVMDTFTEYSFDYGSKEDKNWEDYLNFLYPLPEQLQSIDNRHIVEQLKQSGDNLIKAREVDHWIYFKNKNDRETFLSKITHDGFSIVNTEYDKNFGNLPYKLHIKRIDKVDINSVDKYTNYLWRLAEECDGDYDGWETQVIKD